MSDQPGSAHQLCNLYGRRMTIEQLFRDDKSKRNGWSLRDTQITQPDRLDRLLLILAIAYLLLCGVGLIAKRQFNPSAWCSTNRDIECSIFTIGLIMLEKIDTSPPAAEWAVIELSESVSPNWGRLRSTPSCVFCPCDVVSPPSGEMAERLKATVC